MFYNLKQLRKSKDVSCEEMASLLGLETKSAYSKKENGHVRFTLTEAKEISELFEIPIEEIFFTNKVSF